MKSRFTTLGVALLLVAGMVSPALGQSYDVVRMAPAQPSVGPPLAAKVAEMAPAAPTGFNVEIPIRIVPGAAELDNGVIFDGTQRQLTGIGAPVPLVNFDGQSDADNAAVVGGRIVPPDTDGDVGPNHYIQWINLIAEIYDKNGNSVLGPFPGNAFFAGGAPCTTTNNGDPITLYDQKHDRWVVSQFAINQGVQCVAVSTTGNPLGAYTTYAFTIQGANDYPKLGLWLNDAHDTLSATYRTFGGPGGGVSLDFQVMDYEAMLAGAPALSLIVRGGAPFQEGTLPADVNGFAYPASDIALFGRINDGGTAFDLYAFDGDFPNAGAGAAFGLVDTAALGPIDRGVGNIPQPAPGESLHHHTQFTMHTMVFREYAGTDQILISATADAGGNVGAVYWNDMRATNGSLNFSTNDEGIYSPNNFGPRLERWMPSINSDKNGNIAVGYSASNTTAVPSIRYTGRMAGDPAGTLRDEVLAKAGGGVQISSNNRWGDYSRMSVDPVDDCTFWYTTEYYATTNSFDFSTRITSFRFPDCGQTPQAPTITQTGGNCGGNVTIQGSGFAPGGEVALVRSGNTNGFIKGGPQCNGAIFEVGELFVGGPSFVFANGSGNFSTTINVPANACLVEALDYSIVSGTCLTSNVIDTAP